MKHYTYQPKGVCSRQMDFDVEGGCNGNLKGIAALVEGQDVKIVKEKLKGIDCNGRGTSCPDQLSKALEEVSE